MAAWIVKKANSRAIVCFLLKMAMWVLFAGWLALWVWRPLKSWGKPWETVMDTATTSYFGKAGPVNLLFSAPIFLIAILGSIYLHISHNQQTIKPKCKKQRVSFWTYPIFIQGPLGTVTAAEILILLVFIGVLAWTISFYIMRDLNAIDQKKIPPGFKLWQIKCSIVAGRLGTVSALCLAFLFFPITRGSVLLQLLNISFEISVKYHIWIASVTMVIITAHGMPYVLIWGIKNQLREQLSNWKKIGYSHLAGEIALLAGLIMWLTSIKLIRQRFFEVFYYTHQLYLIFIVFFALHVGDTVFSLSLPGIFLFLLDRYLRLLQSQRTVHVISARKLTPKIVQLVIAKHPSLEFNPMSIILLKLPCLSLLQWHPFSIISTSSIDCDRFSILIKCRRSWTQKLEKFMAYLNWMERPLHLEAAIEGPYGPASSYFLRYETLFLIGGGSGIAPLLSILSEILHQHSIRKENHVPTEVILIWAVRQSEELCILNLISPSMICPKFSEVLQLEVQAYITKEVAPDSEMGTTSPNTEDPIKSINFPEDNKCAGSVCSLSSTNNILWQAAIIACAVVGFFAAIGLLNHFYIYPIDHNTYEVYPWRARVLVTISCMIVGIVIFGSLVFVVWRRNNTSGKLGTSYTHSFEMSETKSNISSEDDDQDQLQDTILTKCKVHYGQQPDLQDIIEKFAMTMAGRYVGVLVCGPESMEQSAASACRHHNPLPGLRSPVAFDFHSISFNL